MRGRGTCSTIRPPTAPCCGCSTSSRIHREALAMHVERSITGDETVAVLERRRGRARRAGAHPLRPAASRPRIRSATRAASRAAATSYIDPGPPGRNPTSSRSTGASATNCSTSSSSRAWAEATSSSATGARTTTDVARTSPYRQRLSGSDNQNPRAPQQILSATTEPLLGSRAACRHGAALLAVQLRRASPSVRALPRAHHGVSSCT